MINNNNHDESWHVDKRVNIAILGAILMQTFGIAWWASSVESRITETERRVTAGELSTALLVRLDQKLLNIEEKLR